MISLRCRQLSTGLWVRSSSLMTFPSHIGCSTMTVYWSILTVPDARLQTVLLSGGVMHGVHTSFFVQEEDIALTFPHTLAAQLCQYNGRFSCEQTFFVWEA
jgi:hypothetical protein